MIVYPVVASDSRARIAASKTLDGAAALAGAVNKRAGNPVLVHAGEAVDVDWQRGPLTLDGVVVPVNPPMGGKSDPHGWVLDRLVEHAKAPRARARRTTAAKTTAAKATPVKTTAAKTATRTRRAPIKAGAAA